jgi:hypothetical protein
MLPIPAATKSCDVCARRNCGGVGIHKRWHCLTLLPMDPSITEISDGDTTWRFDRSFLTSNWSCIWGRGCLGILPEPAAELGQGCCSIGAELDGEDEAHLVSALAATLEASRFEHHAAAVTTPPSPRSLTVARTTIAKPSYRGRGVDQRDQFGPSTELADLGIRHPPNKHFPRRSNVPTPLTREFLGE